MQTPQAPVRRPAPERARCRALRWDSGQCVSAQGSSQIARPSNPSGRAPALGSAFRFAGAFFYVVRNRAVAAGTAAPRSPTGSTPSCSPRQSDAFTYPKRGNYSSLSMNPQSRAGVSPAPRARQRERCIGFADGAGETPALRSPLRCSGSRVQCEIVSGNSLPGGEGLRVRVSVKRSASMGLRLNPPFNSLKNSRQCVQLASYLPLLNQQSTIGNRQFFTPNHT
jgi:hypothetical protein